MQEKEHSDIVDQFIEHCKNSGLKITPQRCAVYREIIQSRSHPTADKVFRMVRKKFPNISYDTVNRTLMTFAEIGLVDVVKTKKGARHFDAAMDNHHHFHCVNCGKIIDFYNEEYDNLMIPDQIQDDFTVFTKRVVLNGLCKQCRKKKKSS